jgi:3-deoxy-D-manno-octulosonic-acid transferase
MKMFKYWYFFLRILYYPLLVWILPLFIPKLKARVKFERKNDLIENSSFKAIKERADVAFEVSSEGELEQIKVVMLKFLEENKKVELIYCSDSLENYVTKLKVQYPNGLRTIRLPLVTFLPWGHFYIGSWLSAPILILCRYDFFPELIYYGRQKDIRLILLSGTMKNVEQKMHNPLLRWYYDFVYKSFDQVVMSTHLDRELLNQKFQVKEEKIETYDFRPIQIYQRLKNKEEQLNKMFPGFDHYKLLLDHWPKHKRVIFGSFWNDEDILNEQIRPFVAEGYHLAIVPHKLTEETIEDLKEKLNKLDPALEIYEVNATMTPLEVKEIMQLMQRNAGVLIINLKGVLCELYSLFGHAYVAGGFRLSVHSLMEPFISGCMVYSGPKIHRSTEFDLIVQNNPDHLVLIENPRILLKSIMEQDISTLSSMHSFKSHYEGHLGPLLLWLGLGLNHKWEMQDV